MRLGELAKRVAGAQVVGAADVDVVRAVQDSRQVRAGDLFVALPGLHVDGHAFVRAAMEAGAAAALVERPVSLPGKSALLVVPDAHAALGLVAHALAGDPTQRLTVCGITGTNGKTTTSYLTQSVLEAAGRPTGVLGTIEYRIGARRVSSTMTTPDAGVLASYFAEMAEAGLKAAVMEVSSHALHQKRTVGIRFQVGAFTNLTPEHLDYHADMDAYREAKQILFAGLAPEAVAVLNADDAATPFFERATAARVIRFGMDRPADVSAAEVRSGISGSRFVLVTPRGRVACHTVLLGEYNVRNCLAAAAIGEALGLPLDAIAEGIGRLEAVRGRLEAVPTDRPFKVLVDYAHKTEALRNALGTVRRLVEGQGRVIVVFGCGGDRDRFKRPEMARVAEQLADRVIVTSDNPRSEDPAAIIGEILKGFSSPSAAAVESDRRKAIAQALGEAQPGDVVIIAGKGHETYQIAQGVTRPFDDCAVAREVLATMPRERCS